MILIKENQKLQKDQFVTYEQFLENTGMENNTESMRRFMVENELP